MLYAMCRDGETQPSGVLMASSLFLFLPLVAWLFGFSFVFVCVVLFRFSFSGLVLGPFVWLWGFSLFGVCCFVFVSGFLFVVWRVSACVVWRWGGLGPFVS